MKSLKYLNISGNKKLEKKDAINDNLDILINIPSILSLICYAIEISSEEELILKAKNVRFFIL